MLAVEVRDDVPNAFPSPSFPTQQADGQLPSLVDIVFAEFDSSPDSEASAVEPFMVDTLSKASWCASRILEAQTRIDQRSELAQSYIERIRSWADSASASDRDTVDYLGSLLKPYVETAVAQQHRSRSLILVSATASLRKLPDRLEITDTTAALAYCKQNHPEAVIIREDLSKTELKRLVFNGNAIPGIIAELGGDKLFVKPAKEGSLKCAS
jgi:uncharacterized protein YqcC (DUF446 family)